MQKSNKRGKIPQSDWPLIMARYDAGETLASIARTYDCSPPAISYVVSRSRARQPDQPKTVATASPPEPQLIKHAPAEAAGAAASATTMPTRGELPATSAAEPPRIEHAAPLQSNGSLRNGGGNGAAVLPPRPLAPMAPRPVAASPANGDQRRTLHLSLGMPTPGNGSARLPEAPTAPRANPATPLPPTTERSSGHAGDVTASDPGERHPGDPVHHNGAAAQRRDGSAFIDHELRARVEADIGAFLAAFDAALDQDTPQSRSALREATDRLLRAGARTRIELERLEARMPLPPRDAGGRATPDWRSR